MKVSYKGSFVVAVMAAVLSACGGCSSSGPQEEQLARVELLPVQAGNEQTEPTEQTERAEQAAQPTETTVPAEAATPQVPAAQEPVIPPLPVVTQTGWTMGNATETRQPLEMLKSVMCVERARLDAVALPGSSADYIEQQSYFVESDTPPN